MKANYSTRDFVIIEITLETGEIIHKLLCSVSNSIDDWRLNSGIVEIIEEDNNLYVYGKSGTSYKINKATEGLSGNTLHIANHAVNTGRCKIVKIDDIVNKYKII